MTLTIDTDNYAASGISVFQFNGGEMHANVPAVEAATDVHVFAKIRSPYDFLGLVAVLDALSAQHATVHLFIPYFPGARQDRNPGGLTPLTVEIYARILAEYVDTLTVVDLHSKTGEAILRTQLQVNEIFGAQLIIIDPVEYLAELIHPSVAPDYVIQVDDGAEERAYAAAKLFNCKVARARKHRDFETGVLSGATFVGTLKPGRYLMADDICDGGRTFINLLHELRLQLPASNSPVDLYVTHGIFSQGIPVLSNFENIYTTDSWFRPNALNLYPSTLRIQSLLPVYERVINS